LGVASPLTLNAELLYALGQMFLNRSDGVVRVSDGPNARALHLVRGELIAADSTFTDDRLGPLLVASGRVDKDLIEPMAAAARSAGRMLGDQLITDGLLTAGELAEALEKQVVLRVERTVTMRGGVTLGPRQPVMALTKRNIAALVVQLFRERFPRDVLAPYANAFSQGEAIRLKGDDERLQAMEMMPVEARALRRILAGEPMSVVAKVPDREEQIHRFVAALRSLGVLA
jgi:hypothetical protein